MRQVPIASEDPRGLTAPGSVPRGKSRALPILAAAAFLAGACSDGTGPDPDPAPAPSLRLESAAAELPEGCSIDVGIQLLRAGGEALGGETVSFEVRGGDGAVTPERVTTDAQGRALVRWTLGEGQNSVRATSSGASPATADLSAEGVAVAPGGYATIGNQIFSAASCGPHRFTGISRSGLEWAPTEPRLADPALTALDLEGIAGWGANLVRIPISQLFWNPASRHYDPGYPVLVDRVVRQARDAGLDVILDLHTSDRGDPEFAGWFEIQQMPDLAHSVPFWRDLARRYGDDGGVIFELYNEPNAISWDVWLNGGTIPGGPQYEGDPYGEFKKPYEAVGMQQLYDVVRETGADNLVILGGTHWGFFLDGVPSHRVDGYNIIYATHPYDYPDKLPATWDRAFGDLAATDPVMITEFGVRSCDSGYLEEVLDYADEKGLSWAAWSWWTPPADDPERAAIICRFPSLISDWSGTPSVHGEVVRRRLSSY